MSRPRFTVLHAAALLLGLVAIVAARRPRPGAPAAKAAEPAPPPAMRRPVPASVTIH